MVGSSQRNVRFLITVQVLFMFLPWSVFISCTFLFVVGFEVDLMLTVVLSRLVGDALPRHWDRNKLEVPVDRRINSPSKTSQDDDIVRGRPFPICM